MIKIEHNVETGEVEEIELTSVEVKAKEKEIAKTVANVAVIQLEIQTKAAEKAALLAKLNITEDEARLLLG
jgi:hypothetical protein